MSPRALRLGALLASAAIVALTPAGARAGDLAERAVPTLRVFHRDDGIPQGTIESMAIEPSGRLWIGTQAGVASYDGRGFARLPLPAEAVSNLILALTVARDGSVWIGTRGGGIYRHARGAFTHYDEGSGLPSAYTGALLESSGTMWAGTRTGLARLEGDRFVQVDLGTGGPVLVAALCEGELPAGVSGLWVGTSRGVFRCEANRCARLTAAGGAVPEVEAKALLEAPDEGGGRSLWVGTKTGLGRFTDGRWDIVTKASSPLPHNLVNALAQTVSGSGQRTLWVGTHGGGLARVRHGTWTVMSPATSALPSLYVQSLLAGAGGRTLWIGTDGGGLSRLRHDGWRAFTPQNAPLGSGGYIEALAESAAGAGGSAIWLAAGEALLRGAAGEWAPVDLASAGAVGAYPSCLERSRRDPSVLWIGTSNAGLVRWDGARATHLPPDEPAFAGSLVHVVRESLDGRALWVGTSRGVARVEDGRWTTAAAATEPWVGGDVFSLLETARADGRTTLWLATSRGLSRLDDGAWRRFDAASSPLPRGEVVSLAEIRDPGGARVLWIGTLGGGVARYDLDADAWRETLTEKTRVALPDATAYQIRADARGRVYLFTHRGVARLSPRIPTPDDPADFSVYTFTTEDGLPADECTGSGALVDGRGRIWAGTVAGAGVLDPGEEVEDHAPKAFASLTAREGDRVIGPREALRWDHSSVSFEFSLLAGHRERDTRFRTQLVGFDPAPGPWSPDGKVRYTNLPPGEYTFKVWGRDYAGNVAGPGEVAFRVRTAPWKTLWAALGYGLAAVGLVYGALRARLRAFQARNRQLEARVRERTQELDEKNTALGQNVAELAAARAETERKNAELDRRVAELGRKNEELEASHRRADRIFSALADALPGTELDGKYRLITCVGQGGFGAVFRARHLALARDVAVKVFRPTPGNDSALGLARFQREGKSASLVSHPNAVQVFDSGVSREGIAYLVMELLEGRSLAEELRVCGRLPLPRAAAVAAPLCAALEAAHAHGILHRDIKPENIFLHRGPAGEVVKVVDFGIAKLVGMDDAPAATQETRGIVGTVPYTSPERLKGEPYDARTDVFSVGVTVFEMLAGVLPFPPGERSLIEQVMHQLVDLPLELAEVAPELPEEVARAVMGCLSRDPAARPSLRALAEVFEPWAPPAAHPTMRPAAPPPADLGREGVDALGSTMDMGSAPLAAATIGDPLAATQEAPRPGGSS